MAMISLRHRRGRSAAEAAAAEAASVSVFSIGANKFVAGLHWKGLNNRNYMAQARRIGDQHKWDIVAVRKGQRVQAGFVSKGIGVTTGMYSVASALAGVLGDKWIGAFRIDDDKFVISAVRDGSILPNYDRVAGAEEAKSALREALSLYPDSGVTIYAPNNFGIGTQELSLAEVLDPKNLRSEYQLRLLGFPWARVAVILGVAVTGFIGFSEYQHYLIEKEKEAVEAERRRQEIELADLNAKARAAQQAKALEHPWAKMPAADDFMKACAEGIGDLPVSIAGWLVTEVKCDGLKITATYRRTGPGAAPLLDFRKAAEPLDKASLIIAENGDRAEVSQSVAIKLAGDEDLREAVEVQEEWISRLQLLGITYQIQETPVVLPAPPVKPGEAPLPPPVATWRLFPLSFESSINPLAILGGFKDLRGVRLKSVDSTISQDGTVKWIVKGELYGKR